MPWDHVKIVSQTKWRSACGEHATIVACLVLDWLQLLKLLKSLRLTAGKVVTCWTALSFLTGAGTGR